MPQDTPYRNARNTQPERGWGKLPSVWFRDDLHSSQEGSADFLHPRGHVLETSDKSLRLCLVLWPPIVGHGLSFWDPSLEGGRLLLHKPTVTFSYFPLGKLPSKSVKFPKIHQLLLIIYCILLKLRHKASHMPSVFSVGERNKKSVC